MLNNKKRLILLSVLLFAIIITGVFITLENKDSNSKKNEYANENETFQQNNEKGKKELEEFYYIEEFVDESIWEYGFDRIFKYNGKIVKFKGWFLQDIESKENIYEIPDVQSGGRYLCINEEEIWSAGYENDSKKIIANYFDNKGNKKGSIELKDFKGTIADDSYIMIDHMLISDEYIYLSARTNTLPTLHIFTKTGELKYSYENVKSFDIDNKGNCVFTTEGSETLPRGFYMVNSETGAEIFRNTSYRLEPIRFSEDGELIYGFDKKLNVFSAKDGGFKESIFEFGKDSTYLLDDYDIQDFMVGEEGDIYYSLKTKITSSSEIKLSDIKNIYYVYTKQEGSRPEKEATITLTAPYRTDFMDEAIKRYELKYPMEHVEYDYAYNNYEKFIENAQEYGAKLALDIISGDIGDIVHTGGAGIEIHNVLATDVFMDLTDLIEKDKNYKDLNKDVLNAININDAIRALPINFMFYQWELNEDLEKELGLNIDFDDTSWSEVLDLVKIIEKKAPDRHLFASGMSSSSILEYLLLANMPDLINLETNEINLNQKWFKDLLVTFKECSKSKNFIQGSRASNLSDRLQGSLLALSFNRGQYYGDTLIHFDKYNKTNRSRMIPSFTGEKNDNRIGASIRMYSINNRSDRKENAWKFLSFLLEEDIQFILSREKTGMPINKKGADKMIEHATNMHNLSGSNIDRYNNSMIENSHKIDYLYNMGYLRLDISNPIELYMKDEITLDEALKKAEENIIIRLNE